MAEGRVDVDTDSALVQLGGDVLKAPVGKDGAVYAGLMGGYGDARSRSVSTLMLPGTTQQVRARARGKVSGYSVGLYGTVYQNDATRLGAYADTWLQYGRYDNQISSELGSVDYRSNVWSASLETGYAFMPFADGSTLGAVVIEPNAQLVYSRYNAKDATLQGTRMRSGNDNAWQSRVGVRVYPQAKPQQADAASVRPFLEANWLHNGSNPSVRMGDNALDALPSRNALELKLGAEGRVTKAVQVTGHVFGQAGSHDQRGYGGMLNVSYRW
jgi:outer membrane autotransporter protein